MAHNDLFIGQGDDASRCAAPNILGDSLKQVTVQRRRVTLVCSAVMRALVWRQQEGRLRSFSAQEFVATSEGTIQSRGHLGWRQQRLCKACLIGL